MGRVFVVQVPRRFEPRTQKMVEYDISSASAFGVIVGEPLFDRNNGMEFITKPAVHRVKKALKDYSDDDTILALGDPSAIALTCVIAAQMNRGKYSVLRWNGATRQYVQLNFET